MPRLIDLCPADIDKYKESLTLFIPFGTVEYHGSQLPVGADILFPEALLEEIDKKAPILIAPTVTCCPNGNAVSGPEKYTIDFSVDLFVNYCYEMLKGYFGAGFKHIVLMVHHQSPGITTMLRLALSKLTMYEVQNELGNGWWTDDKTLAQPWTEIYPASLDKPYFNAHGTKQETEAIMAAAYNTVKMNYLTSAEPHWNAGAEKADKTHADECFKEIVDMWVQKVNNWNPKK